MAYIQIGNIKLAYDETIKDIDRIMEIIKRNQYLFADYNGKTISLVPVSSERENIVFVSNFDQFFDDLLKRLLENDSILLALRSRNLLPVVYLQFLETSAKKDGNTFIMLNNMSDDLRWFIVACNFFDRKTQFRELSEFLKYRNDSTRIFDWLKETQRFSTYNYLLEIATTYFKEQDLIFFEHISEIIPKMYETNTEFAFSKAKGTSYDFAKMPLENLEKIFLSFLDSIKAPEHWKNLYFQLKNEKRILFEESTDGADHSEVFEDTDGKRKIRVTTDGTIDVFISFVHEFIHYVPLQKETPLFSLREFPSIYYERIAANYLVGIGYDENVVHQVIRARNQNNFQIYQSLFGILLDVCIYNKRGSITRDDKIKPAKESMEMIYQAKKNIAKICENVGSPIEDSEFLTMPDYDFGKAVDKECDNYISLFIEKGLLILNGYQYLTDSYLADSLLEKDGDESILDKMAFITEHLAEFDLKKVMQSLGLNNVFGSSTKK